MSESKSPDEQDVLVEVIINNRDVLQFYSTQEYYKTLYEDREALINTVKTAFKEGVLTSVDVKNVEDIQTVRFLSEVVEDNTEVSNPVEEIQVEGEFEEYEVIEEPAVDNITSSEFPEEVGIEDSLTPGAKKPKSNQTPHSIEDQLENDKSNEGNLHIDDTEEHYTDVENDNVQSKRGGICVKEEPFECETILETAEEIDAADVRFVHPNASESMNDAIVANEEHIITSVVDETEIEVMEEYADGVVVNGATVECMSVEQEIEEPHKPKLDFLNKSQTEKLKEFKRLLQEGTQFSQPGSQPRNRQIHSRKRPADLGPSAQGEVENTVVKSANKTKLEYVEEHSPYKSSDSSDQILKKFKGSSILIVDHPKGTTNDNDNSELYEDSFHEEEYMDDDENTNDSGQDELCELCGFKARSRSELKLHIAIHTGEVINNIYKCELCPFKSTRKNDLGRHKTLIHGATPPRMLPFICAICNFRSDSKENLLVHCKTHSMCMVKCKICEEKCQTAKELMNHCKKHIGEEPFECYLCGYLTARKYQLRKHVRRKHGTESTGIRYKCYTCGYQTNLQRDFYRHRGEHKMELDGPKGYKCPHCLFYCFDNKVLDTHLKAHFNGNISGANNVDTLGNISPGINTDVEGRRTPLKEFPSNASESDNSWTKQTTSKVNLLNTSPKKFLREDFIPIKKRRRGLKSLLMGNKHGGSSLIEERLNRKFNFDVKNLCPSDEENDSGFDIELTGEVVKSHGSLRKYSNYGEIISKSQTELATVMANIDNEDNLKVVFEQIKELESQMVMNTNLDEIEFTIYFKDIEDSSLKGNSETISDLDDILSSEDETDHMNDDNDIFTDSDTELLSDSNLRQSRSAKESAKKESSKPQVLFSLDELDESHLKEKIMEQNRKRGELRRQKILSLSSNSTKPTNGPMKNLKNDKGQEEYDENMLIIDE